MAHACSRAAAVHAIVQARAFGVGAAVAPARARTSPAPAPAAPCAQTRAEYKRKAAVLVELLAALQSEAAEEAVLERLAAFRVEIDEPLLHMLAKRLEAAQQHEQVRAAAQHWGHAAGVKARVRACPMWRGSTCPACAQAWQRACLVTCPPATTACCRNRVQDPEGVDRMQQLQALLQLEYERAQATPSLRLLDELLELLGDDPALPGARQRAQQVVARMRAAFTGGERRAGLSDVHASLRTKGSLHTRGSCSGLQAVGCLGTALPVANCNCCCCLPLLRAAAVACCCCCLLFAAGQVLRAGWTSLLPPLH